MIYLKGHSGEKEVHLLILESANLERLKAGQPIRSVDKEVAVFWTPDVVWLSERIKESNGDMAKIAAAIEEARQRPEKPSPRPYHEPEVKHFDKPTGL